MYFRESKRYVNFFLIQNQTFNEKSSIMRLSFGIYGQ